MCLPSKDQSEDPIRSCNWRKCYKQPCEDNNTSIWRCALALLGIAKRLILCRLDGDNKVHSVAFALVVFHVSVLPC